MPRIYRLRELFSAQGRYGRGEFWGVAIPNVVLSALIDFTIEASGGALALLGLLGVPLVVIGINNTTKRLHDHGHSGWWQAALAAFYICLGVASTTMGASPTSGIIVGLIVVVVLIATLVYLGFIPGQPVENRYGPPKSDTAPDRGDLPEAPIP